MFKIKSFKKKRSVEGIYIRGKSELNVGDTIKLHGDLYRVTGHVDKLTEKELVFIDRVDGLESKYSHVPNGAPFQYYY